MGQDGRLPAKLEKRLGDPHLIRTEWCVYDEVFQVILRHFFWFSQGLCLLLCVGFLLASDETTAETARLQQSNLTIRVVGMESGKGAIEYALYNVPKYFPTRQGRIAKGAVAAGKNGSSITIEGLSPGYYAVAIFHDENLNGKFDQGFLGIPLETYGFSNDARGLFSAPDFDDAKFKVEGQKTVITIELSR